MQQWAYDGLEDPVLPLEVIPRILGYQPRTVLELGANSGSDTLRMLDVFPEATFHCLEPEPRAYALLERHLAGKRAHLYPVAVAAADGPLRFHQSSGEPPGYEGQIPDGWLGSGSIHAPKIHLSEFEWCRFESAITVEGVSLDSWAERNGVGDVDFIWADVQGAERELIEGGRATLARTRYLYTEYSDHELYEGQPTLAELLRLLPGFAVVKRYSDRHQGDVLLRNRRPAG